MAIAAQHLTTLHSTQLLQNKARQWRGGRLRVNCSTIELPVHGQFSILPCSEIVVDFKSQLKTSARATSVFICRAAPPPNPALPGAHVAGPGDRRRSRKHAGDLRRRTFPPSWPDSDRRKVLHSQAPLIVTAFAGEEAERVRASRRRRLHRALEQA